MDSRTLQPNECYPVARLNQKCQLLPNLTSVWPWRLDTAEDHYRSPDLSFFLTPQCLKLCKTSAFLSAAAPLWPPTDTKQLFVLIICGLKTCCRSELVPPSQRGCKMSQGSLRVIALVQKISRGSIMNQKPVKHRNCELQCCLKHLIEDPLNHLFFSSWCSPHGMWNWLNLSKTGLNDLESNTWYHTCATTEGSQNGLTCWGEYDLIGAHRKIKQDKEYIPFCGKGPLHVQAL